MIFSFFVPVTVTLMADNDHFCPPHYRPVFAYSQTLLLSFVVVDFDICLMVDLEVEDHHGWGALCRTLLVEVIEKRRVEAVLCLQ